VSPTDVSVITPHAAHTLKSPVLWVDCRDDAERAISVINVDAISEKEFQKHRHRVEDTAERAVVVAYCTIGYRSAQFCLQNPGAINLEGGILNWIHAGYPIWGPDGEPSTRVHVWSEQFKTYVPQGFSTVVYSRAAVALQLPRILLRNVMGM
jgi:rhodanese-related sulfurtransferase